MAEVAAGVVAFGTAVYASNVASRTPKPPPPAPWPSRAEREKQKYFPTGYARVGLKGRLDTPVDIAAGPAVDGPHMSQPLGSVHSVSSMGPTIGPNTMPHLSTTV
eukprot:TRINITY_DN45395_c0_g1_i1.p1 TRINITY_DN45395_c0_g1~~TRINITY_DN45395_c0_g1_i1.p1  ORF type:complete len:105 (+),score=23.91 TRINITY_DN45395_c0_g1_i1:47-361(+)